MKDQALAIAAARSDPAQRLNLLREYLQACILRSFHDSEAFVQLSFVGGTALRFLYNLPRFSEDLDFSLEQARGYDAPRWLKKLKSDLTLMGFAVTATWNEAKTVQVAWVRVADILAQAGLAATGKQKLSIKIEIDTHPPAGAETLVEVVNRHFLFALRHHDLPSLMAGKIHALIVRPYPKGRDWFDLLWYRARRPPVTPNLVMLQHALDQTEEKGTLDAGRWTTYVLERLESLNVEKLAGDVRPFLEHERDGDGLTLAHLRALLHDTSH